MPTVKITIFALLTRLFLSILCILLLVFIHHASSVTVILQEERHQKRVNSGWKIIANSLDYFRFPEDYEARDNIHMYCQRAGDTLNIAVNCDEPRNPDSSTSGAIDRSRPTVILLHGYMGHPKKPWIESMALRTHQFFDANVCIVDWATLAALELNLSVAKLKEVGQRIGECLRGLVDARQESELQRVSLIGYGLGAHLAGCVGKNFNGRLGRIFGLDPLVECSEELLSAGFRLSSRDARLVQVAHTSIGTYGAYRPSGHQDFYFNNGGRSPQPGCSRLPTYQQTACSHFRAVEYLFHSMNETNEFYDTRRREKFGFFTGGKSGRFLVITGSKPPYAD